MGWGGGVRKREEGGRGEALKTKKISNWVFIGNLSGGIVDAKIMRPVVKGSQSTCEMREYKARIKWGF